MRKKYLSVVLSLALAITGVAPTFALAEGNDTLTSDVIKTVYETIDISYSDDINTTEFKTISNEYIEKDTKVEKHYKFHLDSDSLVMMRHHREFGGKLYKADGEVLSDVWMFTEVAELYRTSDNMCTTGYALSSGDYVLDMSEPSYHDGNNINFGIKAQKIPSGTKIGNYGSLAQKTVSDTVYNTLKNHDISFDINIDKGGKTLIVDYYMSKFCASVSTNAVPMIVDVSGKKYEFDYSVTYEGYHRIKSKDLLQAGQYKLVFSRGSELHNTWDDNPFCCLRVCWSYGDDSMSQEYAKRFSYFSMLGTTKKVIPTGTVKDDFSNAIEMSTTVTKEDWEVKGKSVSAAYSGFGTKSIGYLAECSGKCSTYDLELGSDSNVYFLGENKTVNFKGDTSRPDEKSLGESSDFYNRNNITVYDADYKEVFEISGDSSQSVLNNAIKFNGYLKKGTYHVLIESGIVYSNGTDELPYMDSTTNTLKVYAMPVDVKTSIENLAPNTVSDKVLMTCDKKATEVTFNVTEVGEYDIRVKPEWALSTSTNYMLDQYFSKHGHHFEDFILIDPNGESKKYSFYENDGIFSRMGYNGISVGDGKLGKWTLKMSGYREFDSALLQVLWGKRGSVETFGDSANPSSDSGNNGSSSGDKNITTAQTPVNIGVEYADSFEATTWSKMVDFSASGVKDNTCTAKMTLSDDSNVFTLAKVSGASSANPVTISIKGSASDTNTVDLYNITDADTYIFNNIYLPHDEYTVTFKAARTDGVSIGFGVSAVKVGSFRKSATMNTSGGFDTLHFTYGASKLEYDVTVSGEVLVSFDYNWHPVYMFGEDAVQGTRDIRDAIGVVVYDSDGTELSSTRLDNSRPIATDTISLKTGVYKVVVTGTDVTSGNFDLKVTITSNNTSFGDNNDGSSSDTGNKDNSSSSSSKQTKVQLAKPSISAYKHGAKKITGGGVKKSTAVVKVMGKTYKVTVGSNGRWTVKLPKSVYKKTKRGTVIKCYLKKSGYKNSKTVSIKAK